MIDPRWAAARRVLAVRLDNLGDVLVTTPAIHAIRESLPQATITLLASPVGAQAGRLNPDIEAVIEYEAPWMDPWCRLPQDSARELRMVETVRAGRFDAAVIFTSFRQSPLPAAYLCYLADVPLRLAASIDGPGSLLTTRHRHPERMMHEVERGLDLVGAVGLTTRQRHLVLAVPDAARAATRGALRAAAVPDDRWLVVLHPGCSMPARTYPAPLYAAAIELLVARLGATVVLTGTAAERELVAAIRAQLTPAARAHTHDFACAGDFARFCALVEAADVVVTNNTGPMHVAAAVQTPVVALFALTNPPEQWGPWLVPHRQLYQEVPCRLCYARICPHDHACLRGVTPTMVAAAVADLLAEVDARPGGRRQRTRVLAEAGR